MHIGFGFSTLITPWRMRIAALMYSVLGNVEQVVLCRLVEGSLARSYAGKSSC